LGYARCSTRKQGLEGQIRVLTNWAEDNGYQLHLHQDDHTSGRRTDRKGIEAVMNAARGGGYELLAVTELSRIGRSLPHIAAVVQELSELGVKIGLASSGTILDYGTLEGRALLHALSVAADIEWMLTCERNRLGRETIKARGIKVGRKPQPVSTTAMRAMRDKGMSYRQIAAELGLHHSNVLRRLKDSEDAES